MLFDGPAGLPTATLRSRGSAVRHRVIAADLCGWLASRWSWLRPRTVPLIVAFVGMLAVLGATKYLSAYAGGDDLRIHASVDVSKLPAYGFGISDPGMPSPPPPASGFQAPVEITLDRPAPRR